MPIYNSTQRILNKYTNDCILSVNSMVVKCSVTGYITNLKIDKASSEQSEWKLFINMTGNLHETDRPVLLEHRTFPGESRELTRELLEQYPLVKNDLNEYDSYYNTVMENNPGMDAYVRAVLSDNILTMDEILDAEDGAILDYRRELLDEKETSLISKLSEFNINVYKRWLNIDLVAVEHEYLKAFLNMMYQQLALKMLSFRIDNTNTEEVHDYLIYMRMTNAFRMGDAVNIHNNKFKLWLYNNVEYIIENIGLSATLSLLVSNINKLTSLSVSYLEIKPNDTRYLDNGYLEPTYSTDNLGLYNVAEDGVVITEETVEDVYRMEEELYPGNYRKLKELNGSVSYDSIYTKALRIASNTKVKLGTTDALKMAIDNLIYDIAHGNENKIAYFDKKSLINYPLDSKTALAVILYTLSELTDSDKVINKLHYTTLVKRPPHSPIVDSSIEPMKQIEALVPSMDLPIRERISKLADMYHHAWWVISNVDNAPIEADINRYLDSLVHYETFDVNYGDLKTYLDSKNIDFTLYTSHTADGVVSSILRAMTGVELNVSSELELEVSSMKEIITKLTSYTVQVLSDSVHTDIPVRHQLPAPITGISGVSVGNLNFHCLEDNDGRPLLYLDDTYQHLVARDRHNFSVSFYSNPGVDNYELVAALGEDSGNIGGDDGQPQLGIGGDDGQPQLGNG